MPNWNEILQEIKQTSDCFQKESQKCQQSSQQAIDLVRRTYLRNLFNHTKRNVIAYYSAWLTKPNIAGSELNDDDKNAFMAMIHGMDRERGLDLILHTPGGNIAATESLVFYMKQMFGNDIRAIVPQIAMSAGTMVALACRSIIMGKQSNLGPIDPQINGIPAEMIIKEFHRAYREIQEDAGRAYVWQPILSRYTPSFLTSCEHAVAWSKDFVEKMLVENMLMNDDRREQKAKEIVVQLSDTEENRAHSKHIHKDKCKELGIVIEDLESDQALQELVLTCHHCFVHTTSSTNCLKIVENHEGRAKIHNAPPQLPGGPMIQIGFGGPSLDQV